MKLDKFTTEYVIKDIASHLDNIAKNPHEKYKIHEVYSIIDTASKFKNQLNFGDFHFNLFDNLQRLYLDLILKDKNSIYVLANSKIHQFRKLRNDIKRIEPTESEFYVKFEELEELVYMIIVDLLTNNLFLDVPDNLKYFDVGKLKNLNDFLFKIKANKDINKKNSNILNESNNYNSKKNIPKLTINSGKGFTKYSKGINQQKNASDTKNKNITDNYFVIVDGIKIANDSLAGLIEEINRIGDFSIEFKREVYSKCEAKYFNLFATNNFHVDFYTGKSEFEYCILNNKLESIKTLKKALIIFPKEYHLLYDIAFRYYCCRKFNDALEYCELFEKSDIGKRKNEYTTFSNALLKIFIYIRLEYMYCALVYSNVFIELFPSYIKYSSNIIKLAKIYRLLGEEESCSLQLELLSNEFPDEAKSLADIDFEIEFDIY